MLLSALGFLSLQRERASALSFRGSLVHFFGVCVPLQQTHMPRSNHTAALGDGHMGAPAGDAEEGRRNAGVVYLPGIPSLAFYRPAGDGLEVERPTGR